MLVLSVQESLLHLHLIDLPLFFPCLLALLPREVMLILVSHRLVGLWILMILLLEMQHNGLWVGHL
jgi:hypothetical protein